LYKFDKKKYYLRTILLMLLTFKSAEKVFAQEHSEKIGNINISVSLGDITKLRVDAYMVPHFQMAASYTGVGGAVARAGGREGIRTFEDHLQNRRLRFGDASIAQSGGGKAPFLINVVTIGATEIIEFKAASDAVYNGLRLASEAGLKSMAMPALGTGKFEKLTAKQSSEAILAGIHRYLFEGGGSIENIKIVIENNRLTFLTFTQTLKSHSYETTSPVIVSRNRELDALLNELNREMEFTNDGEVVPSDREALILHGGRANLLTMSESTLGTGRILVGALNRLGETSGMILISSLDDMNIRGPQIEIAYKDYCGQNFDYFVSEVIKRSKWMVEYVNWTSLNRGFEEKAVIHGASNPYEREIFNTHDIYRLKEIESIQPPKIPEQFQKKIIAAPAPLVKKASFWSRLLGKVKPQTLKERRYIVEEVLKTREKEIKISLSDVVKSAQRDAAESKLKGESPGSKGKKSGHRRKGPKK
jgi:O-acetyl-ADP-ribose deacetylase